MKTYEPKKVQSRAEIGKRKNIIRRQDRKRKMNQEHTKDKKMNTIGQENVLPKHQV